MEKLSQRKYPAEFSELAVGLLPEQEVMVPAADRDLSLSDQTPAGMKEPNTEVTELRAEVFRLNRELAEARLHCNILKQTVAHFAKAQIPETRP